MTQLHHPAGWHCRCTAFAMPSRVLLIGSDSDLVASVELGLRQLAGMELVRPAGDEALVEAVAAAAPDVMVFSAAAPSPATA